jgi:hypothetical protein
MEEMQDPVPFLDTFWDMSSTVRLPLCILLPHPS